MAAAIALVVFGSGCGDDSDDQAGDGGDYCAELPDYLGVMSASMAGDETDPDRFDEWAASAKEMAAIAPDELRDHWDFVVDYSDRMARAGGDLSALREGDVARNGEAGNAIIEHGTQECGLPGSP